MTGDPIMKYLYPEQNINKCELDTHWLYSQHPSLSQNRRDK